MRSGVHTGPAALSRCRLSGRALRCAVAAIVILAMPAVLPRSAVAQPVADPFGAAAAAASDILTLPAPLRSPAVRSVVVDNASPSGSVVRIDTDAPVAPVAYCLADPPRIVVDLPRVWCPPASGDMPFTLVPRTAGAIERVRLTPVGADGGTRVLVDVPMLLPFRARRTPGATGVTLEVLRLAPRYGIVVLDPGHGGGEPGCVGRRGTIEKDVNLSVALRVQGILASHGVVCLLTRSDDLDADLWDRAYFANESGAKLFVSVHCNASQRQATGTEVYYTSAQSQALAGAVHAELVLALARPDRGVHACRFVVTREAEMPAVLCELAFLDNEEEEALLSNPGFQGKAAEAIARAVLRSLRGDGLRGLSSPGVFPR